MPKNAVEWETLCCHLAKEKYQDNDAQKYGRSGQKQWGVDIRATDRSIGDGQPLVIQCKYKSDPPRFIGNRATAERKQIEEEIETDLRSAIENSHKFNFTKFIYAANIKRDCNLQDFVDDLSKAHKLEVIIWSLEDIKDEIDRFPRLIRMYTANIGRSGVTIINPDFIDDVQFSAKTIASEANVFRFYSGYSGHDEQWLGILNNLDAPRSQSPAIKAQIEKLMARKILESRVAAIVYGSGGSGKSTLLRRLAIDFVEAGKPWINWWIEDITLFLDHDAASIGHNRAQQHLVFVDDWYRNVRPEHSQRLLIWLKDQTNVILLIGDRTNTGKYNAQLFGGYCEQLQPSDNDAILNHVLSKDVLGKLDNLQPIIREVKSQAHLLENVSISVVLFVIAWQYENQSADEAFSLEEGFEEAFCKIIESLLKALEADDRYRGLGQALYLAAQFYADPNSNYYVLSESSLLNIAVNLGENESLPARVSHNQSYPYQMDYLVHKVIVTTASGMELNRMHFNHDVIAEQGIAKIPASNFVLESYDQYRLLEAMIEQENAQSALMLWQWLDGKEQNKQQNDNFDLLMKIIYLDETFVHFGIWIHIIKNMLSRNNKTVISQYILTFPEFYLLPDAIITTALNLLKDKSQGIKAAETILALPEFYQLHHAIISTALNLLKDKLQGIQAAETIFASPKFYQL
ncbi:MAG: hypothetical protein HRT35_27470, partial [Algicola sp.]|nr:hypothetical protein [Algicola sp.]